MNCIFQHKFTSQYVVNQLGELRFTNHRDNATLFNVVERELVAARLDCKPSDLMAETI